MCDELWNNMKYNRHLSLEMKPYLFANENCQGSPIPYDVNVMEFEKVGSYVSPEHYNITFYENSSSFVQHREDIQDVVVHDTSLQMVHKKTLDTHQAFQVRPPLFSRNYFDYGLQYCEQYLQPPPLYNSWTLDDCEKLKIHAQETKTNLTNNKVNMSCSCTNTSGYFPDWAFWVIFGLVLFVILVFIYFTWRSYSTSRKRTSTIIQKTNKQQ